MPLNVFYVAMPHQTLGGKQYPLTEEKAQNSELSHCHAWDSGAWPSQGSTLLPALGSLPP